jgi:hypothetical protein
MAAPPAPHSHSDTLLTCINNVVARGGIEPPTFRFSGGFLACTDVFQLVRPDARPAFGRVGLVGLARWPHVGPMGQPNLHGMPIGLLGR